MQWKYPDKNEFPVLRQPVLIEFKSGDYDNRDLPNDSLKEWWRRNIKRWLDETDPPAPASAVEEAATLYPDVDVTIENISFSDDPDEVLKINAVRQHQRQAHITCAGMYTDTIDKLKEEVERWKDEFETAVLELRELKHKHNL